MSMLPPTPPDGYLRVLHAADLHVGSAAFGPLDKTTGLGGRVLDTLACLDRSIETAIERKAHMVVWAGDLYRDARPDPTLVREVLKRVRRIVDSGMHLAVTTGNHDLSAAEGKASAATVLSYLLGDAVHVYEQIGLSHIKLPTGSIQVLHVPWVFPVHMLAREDVGALTTDALAERMRDHVRAKVQQALADATEEPILAIAHGTVAGATFGSEHMMWQGRDWVLPEGLFEDSRIRYVALGHLHAFQQVGFAPPMLYPGSIDRVDFSEEDHVKGCLLVDIPYQEGQVSWEVVPLPARVYKTVHLDVRTFQTPMTEAIKQISKIDVTGAVVRVDVLCDGANRALVHEGEIRRALSGAYSVVRITKRLPPSTGGSVLPEEDGSTDEDPYQAISRYLEGQNLDATRKVALVQLARELGSQMDVTKEIES